MENSSMKTDSCSRQEDKTKATFILHLQFRKNDSWQGTIQWVERKESLQFRSALELMKIINSVCDQGYNIQMDGLNSFELGRLAQ